MTNGRPDVRGVVVVIIVATMCSVVVFAVGSAAWNQHPLGEKGFELLSSIVSSLMSVAAIYFGQQMRGGPPPGGGDEGSRPPAA